MKRLFSVILFAWFAYGAVPNKFVLDDPIDHPFIWWPQTLLSYQVNFEEQPELNRMLLTLDGKAVPMQLSGVVREGSRIKSATMNFFSDLPSGGHREFVLGTGTPAAFRGVTEKAEGKFITLDGGALKVRIPATQVVSGTAPGPVQAMSRGGLWFGASTLSIKNEKVTRIEATRLEEGPLFITYRLSYRTAAGERYAARLRCISGMDFIEVREEMNSDGEWKMDWRGMPLSFRQAANHPYPFPSKIETAHRYPDYPWEPLALGETNTQTGVVSGLTSDGELPFTMGIYEPWAAYRVSTFANFWDAKAPDAVGVFINDSRAWEDHEYSIWREAPKLQVKFHYMNGALTWDWPISKGMRSTSMSLYDHAKDVEAMKRLEGYGKVAWHDGLTYNAPVAAISHTLFLQNRYGTIHLNTVKNWVLMDPGHETTFFKEGQRDSARDLENRVMNSDLVNQSAITGTRQNGGYGPTVSRRVEEFWIDGFSRLRGLMTEKQRKRLTAVYLYEAYIHAGEEYMPMIPMFSGHPNFLADVKSVPASMPFLFPGHPEAKNWADEFEKYVELTTRGRGWRPGTRRADAGRRT